MALTLDEFVPPKRGPRCTMFHILNALSEEDRKVVQTVLDDARYEGNQIADVLSTHGHSVKGHTVNRHRQGLCSC